MFGFKRKKEEKPEEKEEDEASKIAFQLSPDGSTVFIQVTWPKPESAEEAKKTIATYAYMLYLIASGKLLPTIKEAVGAPHSDEPVVRETGKAIVNTFNQIMEANGLIMNDKPMISPQETFSVRGPIQND